MVSLTLLKADNPMDGNENTKTQQVIGNTIGNISIAGEGNYVSLNEPVEAETTEALPVLTINSRGKEVVKLQKQLLELGFLKGRLNESADGVFGPSMRAAVQAFQKSVHTEPDGIVGPKTWVALQNATLHPFTRVDAPVYAIAISPNGTQVVVGSKNGSLSLLNLYKHTSAIQFNGKHNSNVTSIAFSLDGQNIVSGSEDATVRIWDLRGNFLEEFSNNGNTVTAVAYHSRNKKQLFIGGGDGTLSSWNAGKLVFQNHVHEDVITSIAVSSDGQFIVTGSYDNTIRVFDSDGTPVGKPFLGHTNAILAIAITNSQEKYIVASGSADKTIRLWDIYGNPIGQPFQGHEEAIWSVVFSPDGRTIFSSSTDRTIRLWNILDNQIIKSLQGHNNAVRTIVITPNGSTVISGSDDQTIRLWDIKTGKQLPKIPFRINIGQELENDLAQGDDRLNIKTEIDALTNVLMLRDLKPPLAVGILGGWGSGKSFGLHLMKQRINEIRSEALTENQAWGSTEQLFPYVGHIYQIEFDAWTYAKSNLWASLMQKIFFELNRQISLEQKLKAATVDLLKGGQIWKALNNMSDEHRRQILESHLTPEIFKEPDLYRPWEDIEASQKISSVLWEKLGKLKQDEILKLRDEQESLLKNQNQLSKKQIEIETKVDQKIRQDSRALLWKPLREDLSNVMGKTFDMLHSRLIDKDDADKVKIILDELEPDFWQSLIKTFQRNPVISILFILSLALLAASPLLLVQLNNFLSNNVSQGYFSSLIRKLVVLLTTSPAIISGIPFLQKAWNGWKRYRKQVKQVLDCYQQQVLAQQEELVKSRQAFVEIEKAKDIELVQLEEKVKHQQAHIEQQQQRISLTTNYKSLSDLIDARLQTDPYSEQLGLLQQVKSDIEELTDRLVINNDDPEHIKQKKLELFPRGPARVVLYIDDLDRCPPNKVVEVLEAVQLLVKTSLFIVVLAIDDRYVARALEEVYKGVLKRRGKPSGIDYLEKIIQIPYRMRPISPSNLKSYLEFQMKVEEEEQALEDVVLASPTEEGKQNKEPEVVTSSPSETTSSDVPKTDSSTGSDKPAETPQLPDTISEVIKFSRSEFELLSNCCKHVDLSPRTAKRLINIYKILKIVWSRYPSLGLQEPQAHTKQVAITFLALSGRYPNFMRHLFEEIDTQFEELSSSDDDNPVLTWKLTDLLQALHQQTLAHDSHHQREWRKFNHDAIQMLKTQKTKASNHESEEASAQEPRTTNESFTLDRETFDLALSFCFVGDIGYDPADYDPMSQSNFQDKSEQIGNGQASVPATE